MSKEKGFTLFELITSLSVVTILLSLAIPSLKSFLLNQNMVAQSNELVSHLNYGRYTATVMARRLIMCPSTDKVSCTGGYSWDGGWIIFIDENYSRNREPGEEILRIQTQLQHDIDLTSSSGRPRVNFFPDGTTPGSNATFTLCDERGSADARAVIISNVGRVRLIRGNASGKLSC